VINPKFFRPTEVELLLGDSSKARQKFQLGTSGYVRAVGGNDCEIIL
jgi:GDP-D-mannose dehydratase